MMAPRVVPTIAPPVSVKPLDEIEINFVPPPNYDLTKEAYCKAAKHRRENESSHRPYLRVVSAVSGMTIKTILSPVQTKLVVRARQITYFLVAKGTDLGWKETGRRLNRDHSSVVSGCRRVERLIRERGIEVSPDPVEMCQRLWSADWSTKP